MLRTSGCAVLPDGKTIKCFNATYIDDQKLLVVENATRGADRPTLHFTALLDHVAFAPRHAPHRKNAVEDHEDESLHAPVSVPKEKIVCDGLPAHGIYGYFMPEDNSVYFSCDGSPTAMFWLEIRGFA